MLTKFVRLTSFAAALLMCAAPVRSQQPSEQTATETSISFIPAASREAPPKLVLSDIKGARRKLSQFKGRVVVVNFWATWCVPCQTEMPEFTKVYEDYRGRGVEFLGAANEPRSSRPKVQEFMRVHGIEFPVWLEASEKDLANFRLGTGLPGTAIVDKEGRVAVRITGATDGVHLKGMLDRVLAEEPPSIERQ